MTASRQVVCAHCDAAVRVPAERIAERPRCPRCHEALFEGQPVELTAANFDQHVANSERAGRRRLLGAVVRAVPRDGAGVRAGSPPRRAERGRFAKLNTDEAQEIAVRYGIRSIPTLMVFKGGREAARQPGAMNAGSFDAGCNPFCRGRLRRHGPTATIAGTCAYSSTTSRSFASTCSPGRATTSATLPSRSARTVVSIFIASIVTSTSPRVTLPP